MSNIDTNIDNYTMSELMAISGVSELDPDEITSQTNTYINKYKTSNPQMSTFFKSIQSQLLQYSSTLNNTDDSLEEAQFPASEAQTNNWTSNEALKQSDTNQQNKTTERKQKIDVYGNQHVPMNREQLGVNNNFNLPVVQDSLNPNLKNTISRFINLDSQFRQYSSHFENSSTDYTLDLSDRLNDVLSIRLYSYQIPFTWYTIDIAYGNTCFWITDGSCNVAITIPSGNYSGANFTDTLNKSLIDTGFNFASDTPVTYNSNSGKLLFSLFDGSFNGLDINGDSCSFIISQSTVMTFFDATSVLQCQNKCVNKSYYVNQTLGWNMGFRVTYTFIDPSGNIPQAILDLNGTKYLILAVDDYNQNHVNNSLVSIGETTNFNIKMPSYYSPDLPYVCSNTNTTITSSSSDLLIAGKSTINYNNIHVLIPSAPRTLTQSQIYTINEINRNKNNNTNYKAKAPTTTDILSVIPIKISSSTTTTGSMLMEYSGSLQDNVRTYFGPVNIDKMRIKLLDDKGNVLNLNGCDWCVTLICDCLYQY